MANPYAGIAQPDFIGQTYPAHLDKKPRISDIGEGSSQGKEGESDGDDDEDDDEDDDGEDGVVGAKGTPSGRGKGRGGKGAEGKSKVKLTRGSRCVVFDALTV